MLCVLTGFFWTFPCSSVAGSQSLTCVKQLVYPQSLTKLQQHKTKGFLCVISLVGLSIYLRDKELALALVKPYVRSLVPIRKKSTECQWCCTKEHVSSL